MSHRTNSEVLNVRNVCRHRCFEAYRSDNPSISGCDGGCGYCGSNYSHDVLINHPVPINKLNKAIADHKGKRTWLYVLDFFDDIHFDIFEALEYQDQTPLIIEGCVASFYKNYMDKVDELKCMGISEIWFGVESASERLRKSYQKPAFTNTQLMEIMSLLKVYDIQTWWYLVYGPEDTGDTIRETNEMVRKCNPDGTWFSMLVPHKNTEGVGCHLTNHHHAEKVTA